MDIAQFRTNFPEFADAAKFPAGPIAFWSGLGEKLISSDRFGSAYGEAVALFTAHNLVLAIGNARTAAGGGIPGRGAGGAVSSKSVGSVSVSYDTASSMEDGAGHWNLTTYGQQYVSMARLFGHGGYQL